MTTSDFPYKRVTRHGHHRSDSQGHVLEHILIAEKALGKPLPLGAQVHHVDEDATNNSNRNLVICQDAAYHKLLHYRARLLAQGVDPNTHRICSLCRAVKPLEAFGRSTANKASGRQNGCLECLRAYNRRYVRPSKRVSA